MTRRLLIVLLAAAILLPLLSGCALSIYDPYEIQTMSATGSSERTPSSAAPDFSLGTVLSETVTPVTTSDAAPHITATVFPPIIPPEPIPEPTDTDLVLLSDYLPEAKTDIRYATTDNFTGQVIYERAEPRLRYGTVKKLRQVCDLLAEKGYRLVIWDAWRPAEAQWKLWSICPDPTYVSNPNNGYSSHTRGGTVDITLIKADGTSVEMPTDFDDFSKAADLDFSDVSAKAAENAQLMQEIMIECGFKPYRAEWWHFTDTTAYDVLESLPA